MIVVRCLENSKEETLAKKFLTEQMAIYYGRPLDSELNKAFSHLMRDYTELYKSCYLFAFHEDKIVGSIMYKPIEKEIPDKIVQEYPLDVISNIAYLGTFYVDKEYQGKGVGRQLYNRAMSDLKQSEYTSIFLHTHRFLEVAYSFWQSVGFELLWDKNDEWETLFMYRKINL